MLPLCTAEEMRALDGHAINTLGIPSTSLMETAGRGAAEAVALALGDTAKGAHVVVLCGGGNNGGDGFVLGRVLHSHCASVQILCLATPANMSPDAALNHGIAERLKIPMSLVPDEASLANWSSAIQGSDVVVDALFGTGLSRPLSGHFSQACRMISESRGLRVALDVPSGIDATTGHILGEAVKADLTLCFGALKWGLVLGSGAEHAGTVEVHDIGIPPLSEQHVNCGGRVAEELDVAQRLPARPPDGHKGSFGHVLIFGGSPGFSGAAVLAAKGAFRSGAGLVTVSTDPITRAVIHSALPEAMTVLGRSDDRESPLNLEQSAEALGRAKALVIGPGLGQSDALAKSLFELLNTSTLPVVLDADALHLVSKGPQDVAARTAPTILTPHPGEMSALLGCTSADVQADRRAAVLAAAKKFDCTVVLKGHGSLTATPDGAIWWNPTGGPWLATAGSGDVLAGCIGALLAANIPLPDAGWLAVYLHGYAGDMLRDTKGDSGLLAGEIAEELLDAAADLIPKARMAIRVT